MNRFVCLAFFLCMVLSGCLVDSPKSPSSVSGQTPGDASDPSYFQVRGRAVKGVLNGAIIDAYPLIAGSPADSVAQAVTDRDGFYELRIPREYLGRPAVIAARINESLMACDFVSGCNEKPFGEDVLLNTSLVLHSGIPALTESGVFNVTVLTHLGYELARPALGDIATGNGMAEIAVKARLTSANSRLASVFGIVGDLPTHDVIDITDLSELNESSVSVLRYSVINAAILEAALATYTASDYSYVLDQFAGQLREKGISGNLPAGSSEITQLAVIDKLILTYKHLQTLIDGNYNEQLSELFSLRVLYANEQQGQYVSGVASETADLTYLEKAKRMVKSVREIALSLDLRKLVQLSSLSGFVSGGVSDALQGFGVVVDTSQVLRGEKTDRITGALGASVRTVLDTLILHYQGKALPAEINGIAVSHDFLNRRHSISLQGDIDVCEDDEGICLVPVNLLFVVEVSSFGGSGTISLLEIKGLHASLSGVLGNQDYQFVFPGVDTDISMEKLVVQEGTDQFEGQMLLDVQDWSLYVPFQVIATENDLTTHLEGLIDTSGNELVMVTQEKQEPIVTSSGVREFQTTNMVELYELSQFNLSVSFSITASSNDGFFAAINVVQDSVPFSGHAVYTATSKTVCQMVADFHCQKSGEESQINGESADNFVRLSASAVYKASLKAIQSPVMIQIAGSRQSPSVNNINTLKVSYPGHAVSLNGRFNNNGGITSLDAKNLDGMHLYFDAIDGKRAGVLETPFKEKVADIVDMGQWVKVRYINGDFESL